MTISSLLFGLPMIIFYLSSATAVQAKSTKPKPDAGKATINFKSATLKAGTPTQIE